MSDADDWGDEFVAEEWMTLLEATDAVATITRMGYIEAKSSIIELIADSRLDLRCLRFRDEANIGDVNWKFGKLINYPGRKERGFKAKARNPKEPLPVHRTFFGRSEHWNIDPARIDWEQGVIIAVRPEELRRGASPGHDMLFTRRACMGIIIKRSGIPFLPSVHRADTPSKANENPSGAMKASVANATKRGTNGERLKKFDDAALMADLRAKILDGSIAQFGKPNVWGTQAKLERYMALHMTRDDGVEPGEKTVRDRAVEIMEAWRGHVAARA